MRWFYSLVVVFGFAVLGVFVSGNPTTGSYGKLAQPAISPPLWGWMIVAACYNAMMVVILSRLWRERRQHIVAISAVLAVLLSNELWNVFLFRLNRPDLAFWTLFPFAALVVFTTWRCFRADRVSGGLMLFYCFWLVFDLVWARHLMIIN